MLTFIHMIDILNCAVSFIAAHHSALDVIALSVEIHVFAYQRLVAKRKGFSTHFLMRVVDLVSFV
jgi:hypothetical protein